MDFGKLLSVAKRNTPVGGQNGEVRYYSTKFAPPKKECKEKKLSDNIKKFLAKKDEEEQARVREARRKTEELVSKRDVKAKKKIEKMLKVIKSANKSVLDDATDAQVMASVGPEQPDEDDYGYTSNVASQFYQQLMDKYKSNPEEQKFKEAERRTMSKEDLARTRARVKDAIMRQVEEENVPRSRKSRIAGGGGGGAGDERDVTTKSTRGPDPYDPVEEQKRRDAEAARVKAEEKKKMQRRKGNGAPPPPDFASLLKLAEQKQKEPIRIDVVSATEKRRVEPERLMTKREKKEHDERMAFFEMKRLRDRIKDDPDTSDKEKQQRLEKLDALRAAGKLPGIPPSGGDAGTRIFAPSRKQVEQPVLGKTQKEPYHLIKDKEAIRHQLSKERTTGNNQGAITVEKQAEQPVLGRIQKEPHRLKRYQKESTNGNNQEAVTRQATSSSSSLSGSSQNVKEKPQQSTHSSLKSSTKTSSTHREPLISSLGSTANKGSAKPTSKELSSNGQIQRTKTQTSSSSNSSKPSSSSSSSSTIIANAKSSTNTVSSVSSRAYSVAGPLRGTTKDDSVVRKTERNEKPVLKNGSRQPTSVRPVASSGAAGSTRRPPTEVVTQTRQFPPPDVQRSIKRPPMRANGQQRPPTHSSAVKKRRVIDSDSEYDSEMEDFIDDGDCEEDYSSAIKEIFGYDKSRYRDEYYDDDEDYNMESSYAQQMREEYISKKIGILEDLEDMRMEEEEKRRKTGKKGTALPKKK